MKQTMILLFLISTLMLFLNSCKKVVGTGPVVTEIREISGFDGISLAMDATVHVKQDSFYHVEVAAQSNIQKEICTELSGSSLLIKHRNNLWIKSDPITITVFTPHINSLEVSGSGKIAMQTALLTQNLDAEISGSGSITMPELTCQNLEMDISGSGKINIQSGSVNNQNTEISGSGDIYTQYVLSQFCTCKTSGSGTTKVYVAQKLNVNISGSGDVFYRGTPIVNANISGSGKVQSIN